MKTYISFSGGVESTTMCLLYGAGATAIFSDTGSEHKEMYERIDYVEKMLKAHHNGNFELIRLRAEVTTDGVVVNSLTDYIKKRNYFPLSALRKTIYWAIFPSITQTTRIGNLAGFSAINNQGFPVRRGRR
jgi:hypothetical protein